MWPRELWEPPMCHKLTSSMGQKTIGQDYHVMNTLCNSFQDDMIKCAEASKCAAKILHTQVAHHNVSRMASGKRGLVLEKPRLLWVSLETIKTLKIQRLLGRPWRNIPWVWIAQSTPKAFPKHSRAFPEHLQSILRSLLEHSKLALSSLEYGLYTFFHS